VLVRTEQGRDPGIGLERRHGSRAVLLARLVRGGFIRYGARDDLDRVPDRGIVRPRAINCADRGCISA
jgi:hypothetical protein